MTPSLISPTITSSSMVSSEMRGAIEAGKYADLVIWDRAPLEVSVEGLREIIVETTLLAWRVVYSRT